MITKLEFCNLVEEICKNPKEFTENGTFFEVGQELSFQANQSRIFGEIFFHGLDPFHRWLTKYEEFRRKIDFVSWGHILERFKSEETAFAEFPNLFRQFIKELQMKNNFLITSDFSHNEIESLFDLALQYKNRQISDKPLSGKSVGLVFFNPSLRTRASMQVGIYELGGNAVILEPGGTSWTLEHRDGVVMDSNKTEHLKEFVRVLERYVSAIGVRTFAELKDWDLERTEPVLSAFAKYATKPIINLESAMHHPCQSLADMLTIREKLGVEKKKVLLTWAWHPKPLPMAVPNSFALAAAQMGHDLRIAHPKGYELDDELMTEISRQTAEAGGSLEIVNDVESAYEDVEVVYAKSWGSKNFYGDANKDIEFRSNLRADWIVDEAKMAKTNNGIFMHCLPVRRNVIVTDGVIDSPNSVVIDEAENRLHIQKAIMTKLLDGK